MYFYARKFEILKFELAKVAKIYASGFVMFCNCSVAKHVALLPPKTSWIHSAWICYTLWNDRDPEDLQQIVS